MTTGRPGGAGLFISAPLALWELLGWLEEKALSEDVHRLNDTPSALHNASSEGAADTTDLLAGFWTCHSPMTFVNVLRNG